MTLWALVSGVSGDGLPAPGLQGAGIPLFPVVCGVLESVLSPPRSLFSGTASPLDAARERGGAENVAPQLPVR